jgi:hypothetical protein
VWYLLDGQARVRRVYAHSTPAHELVADLRRLRPNKAHDERDPSHRACSACATSASARGWRSASAWCAC